MTGGKVTKSKTGPAEQEQKKQTEKTRFVFATGKRKTAVARAVLKPGKGIVKINATPLNLIPNRLIRMRIEEPIKLAGEAGKKYDIKVNVKGGGQVGQAEAARQAISRALIEVAGDSLREAYLSYDRNLLVYDPRRTEPHKPPHSSWGPRRYKQRSKR